MPHLNVRPTNLDLCWISHS